MSKGVLAERPAKSAAIFGAMSALMLLAACRQ